jgi:hypothetical protein
MEMVVRLAAVRFPDYELLNDQLGQLVEAKLLPLPENSVSLEIFDFCLGQPARTVLDVHGDALFAVFEKRSLGRVYGEGKTPSLLGRQAGINGRRDIAIRISDVLAMLEELGLLTDEPWILPPPNHAIFKAVTGISLSDAASDVREIINDLAEGGLHVDDDPGVFSKLGFGAIQEDAAGMGFSGGFGGFAPHGEGLDAVTIPPRATPSGDPSMFSESGVAPTSGPSRTDYATTTGAESSYEFAAEKEIEVVMPKVELPSPKDVLKNDLRVNRKEVVGILSEVLSPSQRPLIRATTAAEDLPPDCVSLVTYLESEIIFFEFVRLLYRISEERVSSDARPEQLGASNARLTMQAKFEGYVAHAFLPAVAAPYVPPEKPPAPEPAALAEAAEDAEGDQEASKELSKELSKDLEDSFSKELSKDSIGEEVGEPRPVPVWERSMDPIQLYTQQKNVVERDSWKGFTPKGLPDPPRRLPKNSFPHATRSSTLTRAGSMSYKGDQF